ncbi:MFS transporter [Paraburkholderia terrae]|uniref:arabinose transporter n=1 Tax=Paraburkholderia terrae TaxID=311230 RepID=UPI0030E0A96E
MSDSSLVKKARHSVLVALVPVMAAVLAGFTIIGVALPVLPLHVSDDLRLGTLVIGLVAGAQFAASLISRVWAGSYSDRHGAKRGVVTGLIAAVVAGLLYLLSLAFANIPFLSIAVLVTGRAVLGGAESFIITAGVAWGLGLVDRKHAGKVIAWIGTAMFAAMALGGPIGTVLYRLFGFPSTALITALLPLIVLAFLIRMPALPPHPHARRSSFRAIMRAAWLPGLGAALASVGYCAILTFGSLFFAEMNWHPVWIPFSAFGVALIVARTFAGHLPDRFGGAQVALVFVVVQAAGLLLMSAANTTLAASAGAVLAGFGYSLVYPGLGVEAVKSTTPDNCGLTMGIYTAFLDVAMAAGGPMLGWIGGEAGLQAVFQVSSVVVFCTAGVAVCVLRRRNMPA